MSVRIITLCLIVIAQAACSSTKPCTIELEQAPELRGFRLGMSLEDIRKRFPGFPGASSKIGLSTVEISCASENVMLNRSSGDDYNEISFTSGWGCPEVNKDVKQVELKLLDWRLIEITVYYSNNIKWKSVDEFARKTGEALKLDGTWQKVGDDDEYSQMRSMDCGKSSAGFLVYAGFSSPPFIANSDKLPYVRLKNLMGGELEVLKRKGKIEEKTKREEEECKQIFKP